MLGAVQGPLSLRFGTAICSNWLTELACLPFGEGIQDYQEHFNAVVCHVPQLLLIQKTDHLFVGGL